MSPLSETIGGIRAYGFASLPGGSGWIGIYTATSSAYFIDLALSSDNSSIYLGGGYHYGVLTSKLNSSGAIQWQNNHYFSTTYGGGVAQVAIDSSENLYTFGTMNTSSSEGGYRQCITKFNSSGTLQWQKTLRRLNGSNPDETYSGGCINASAGAIGTGRNAQGVWPGISSVDTSGNSRYIKVFSSGGSDNFSRSRFDGSGFIISGTTAGSGKGNVYKMSDGATDGAGGWKVSFTDPYGSEGTDFYDVSLSSASSATSVYVAGTKWRSQSGGIADGQIVKLDNTSTTSSVSVGFWNSYESTYSLWLQSVHYDSVKNAIYAAGYVNNGSKDEGLILKIGTSGALQWARTFSVKSGATVYNTYIQSVKTDSTGQLYLCGNYNDGTKNQCLVVSMPPSGAKRGDKSIGGLTISYSSATITATTQTSPGVGGGQFGYDGGTLSLGNNTMSGYSGPLSGSTGVL